MATTVALTQKLRADDIFSPQWRCSFSGRRSWLLADLLLRRQATRQVAQYTRAYPWRHFRLLDLFLGHPDLSASAASSCPRSPNATDEPITSRLSVNHD